MYKFSQTAKPRVEEDTPEDEFSRELEAEMLIDIDRLRDSSRYGIPASRRAQVWKYLLGVTTVDKREELTLARKREEEYLMYSAFHGDPPLLAESVEVFHELYGEVAAVASNRMHFRGVMRVFLKSQHTLVEEVCATGTETCWLHAAVQALHVFLMVMDSITDVHFAFSKFMLRFYDARFLANVRARVAQLSMLFRYTQPALAQSFENEAIYPNEWALGWVAGMLAGALPFENVIRLWDTYLSETGGEVCDFLFFFPSSNVR